MEQLKEVARELGNPGLEKLWKAVKKQGIEVSKEQLRSYLAKQGQKQLFLPPPSSKGKTAAEGAGTRAQCDLIDLKYSSSLGHKNILVVIDVFSRKAYARPVKNKEAASVAGVMRVILNEMTPMPQFMYSDKGNEWTGPVQTLFEEKNVTHRSKTEKYDAQATSVVDRVIQNLKKRLAESIAAEPGEWATRILSVTRAYNSTPHQTLHNEPPKEINSTNPIANFMVTQDNAQKLQHNVDVLRIRKALLDNTKAFRRPLGGQQQGAFRRGFKQTWGDVEEVERVDGSLVQPRGGGEKVDIKRIMPVDAQSGNPEATFAQGDANIQRKMDAVWPLMIELYHWLGDDEKSMSKAATHLKNEFSLETYLQYLRKGRFNHLSDAVRLFEEVQLTQGGFYIKQA